MADAAFGQGSCRSALCLALEPARRIVNERSEGAVVDAGVDRERLCEPLLLRRPSPARASGANADSSRVHCRYQSSPLRRSIASSSAVSSSRRSGSPSWSAASLRASMARARSCSSPLPRASSRARSPSPQGAFEIELVGEQKREAAEDADLQLRSRPALARWRARRDAAPRSAPTSASLSMNAHPVERVRLQTAVTRVPRRFECARVVGEATFDVAGDVAQPTALDEHAAHALVRGGRQPESAARSRPRRRSGRSRCRLRVTRAAALAASSRYSKLLSSSPAANEVMGELFRVTGPAGPP